MALGVSPSNGGVEYLDYVLSAASGAFTTARSILVITSEFDSDIVGRPIRAALPL